MLYLPVVFGGAGVLVGGIAKKNRDNNFFQSINDFIQLAY